MSKKNITMKTISKPIRTLFTLFFVGALLYGGLKEGYVWQTILILGGIFFFYLFSLRKEELGKIKQDNQERENSKKFNEQLEKFICKIYSLASTHGRISQITYHIKEGGHYLTEYDYVVRSKIDNIIKQYIQYPNNNFDHFIPKIQNEILDLPIQPKKKYIGF